MDRRIKYTKKVLSDTLIELLSKKDIKKITVTEVCKIADINRATFYRYYLDVYDLLNNIENDFVKELKEVSDIENKNNSSVSSFSKDLLNVFVNHKDLVKILFNIGSVHFLNDFLELAYNKCRDKWLYEIPDLSDEEIEYAALFIFNGAIGVVNFWIQNDFDKNVDEVADIIEKLSYNGINKFIYGKKKASS